MKINSISYAKPVYTGNMVSRVEKQKVQNNGMNLRVISMSDYMASPLSFKGRNKEQAIFYGAEVAPYSKKGGVGVVMKDYGLLLDAKNEVVVSPYYGGQKDKETGKIVPLKDGDGDYVLKVGNDLKKLDLVASKTMQWGKTQKSPIMLFRLRDEAEKVHYFVFDETVGEFEEPYKAPKTKEIFTYATGAKSSTKGWEGDAYAKNSKAFVELLPELIKDKEGFNPATVVCSDSQTAYTHEYLVQKSLTDKDYDEIKSTHVGHNLGPGYCGETSMQNMFVNLGATPKQIAQVEKDPMLKLLGDKYFEPFVKETLDERGAASATQIALHYADKARANGNGFVKAISVVAEDYADSIANNPQAAHNIHKTAKKLYDDGVFNGILNPLQDPSIASTKPLPNKRFMEDCKDDDGTIFPKFDIYPENATYSQMKEIKNANKQKLLERFSAKDISIITGTPGKKARVNPEAKGVYDGPVIKPEIIDLVKQGKGDEVPVFVSWGRLDTQKGFDITIEAFKKFAKTPEGKNAVLIVGAGTDRKDFFKKEEGENAEVQNVIDKVTDALKDPDLQGRIVHIDGWAPGYALASASDIAIFTSRFEPCGLTDIEAMKYYCTPLVTNTQGFKQKNFDPRNPDEAHKATSFKTQHEFHLLKSQVQTILDAYGTEKPTSEALAKVKAEFPVFAYTDEKGEAQYDDTLFKNFAAKYNDFINEKRAGLVEQFGKDESKFPEGWNDWDELSKDHDFKFKGFARELKDGILVAETAEALSAFASTPQETKELMFDNMKKLDTSWNGNGNLHPSGQSSADMYKKLHMYSDYSKPTKDDVIAKDDKFISDTIESRQTNDLKERLGSYLLGAATAAVAATTTVMKKLGKNAPNEKELLGRIDDLSKQLTDRTQELADKVQELADKDGLIVQLRSQLDELGEKITETTTLKETVAKLEDKVTSLSKSGNRNIAIAAAVGAIGASAITLLVKKQIDKKKAANAEAPKTEAPAATAPVATAPEQTTTQPAQAIQTTQTTQTTQTVAAQPVQTPIKPAYSQSSVFADLQKRA